MEVEANQNNVPIIQALNNPEFAQFLSENLPTNGL